MLGYANFAIVLQRNFSNVETSRPLKRRSSSFPPSNNYLWACAAWFNLCPDSLRKLCLSVCQAWSPGIIQMKIYKPKLSWIQIRDKFAHKYFNGNCDCRFILCSYFFFLIPLLSSPSPIGLFSLFYPISILYLFLYLLILHDVCRACTLTMERTPLWYCRSILSPLSLALQPEGQKAEREGYHDMNHIYTHIFICTHICGLVGRGMYLGRFGFYSREIAEELASGRFWLTLFGLES